MAHIDLGNDLPGIRGPMVYSPATAKPLNELAELLLRDDNNTLSRGERELIGAYTSYLNDCFFCQNVHGSLAQHYLQCDMSFIDAIKENYQMTLISEKLKSLLGIAASVQKGGKSVTAEQIEHARSLGATDQEIHDTVLIAALFCLYNRYVDGLATVTPTDPAFYQGLGERLRDHGYNRLPGGYDHLKKK